MRYSCGCDNGIRITKTKQTLQLEIIGVHDRHSHIGGKMHACKSAQLVGSLTHRAKDLQMTNLVGGAPFANNGLIC